jgi:hypothetical protein
VPLTTPFQLCQLQSYGALTSHDESSVAIHTQVLIATHAEAATPAAVADPPHAHPARTYKRHSRLASQSQQQQTCLTTPAR